MRKFYLPKQQFTQVDTLEPHTWIKVVQPTSEDIDYLCDELGIPDGSGMLLCDNCGHYGLHLL